MPKSWWGSILNITTRQQDYVRKLRVDLPRRFPGVEFFFQPADIVTQILNFGLPAPIDIQVVGANMTQNYEIAQQIANRMRHIPGTADVHVQQMLDLPTLRLDMDRTRITQVGTERPRCRAERPGIAQRQLSDCSELLAEPDKRCDLPGCRTEPAVPRHVVAGPDEHAGQRSGNSRASRCWETWCSSRLRSRPAVVNHYNVQPVIDVYASTQGRDLGAVASDTMKVLEPFQRSLPRGTRIIVRGQVETMQSSFFGLGIGLLMAILLIYFLIVVNFQSWLDPFIIITALPGALAGICWILLLTRTTLSVPALTGSVMCMGVATANSILMVSFARDRMRAGLPAAQAVLEAGFTRIRPVLMTALAMIIGMFPMALGFGEGGEQNAPLGRAVIGGLLFATAATLFFVPSVFAIIHGRRENRETRFIES